MQSPLFHTFDGEKSFISLRVAYNSEAEAVAAAITDPVEIAKFYQGRASIPAMEGRPRRALEILSVPVAWENAMPVTSVEEAEDYILGLFKVENIEVRDSTKELGSTFLYEGEYETSTPVLMNRRANIIAARTRRGAGNIALVGRDIVEYLKRSTGFNYIEGDICGRWQEIGFVNSSLRVYTGDAIPADEVVVSYVGFENAIDGPGGLLVRGDEMRLFVQKPIETALGDVTDYVSRFRISVFTD